MNLIVIYFCLITVIAKIITKCEQNMRDIATRDIKVSKRQIILRQIIICIMIRVVPAGKMKF